VIAAGRSWGRPELHPVESRPHGCFGKTFPNDRRPVRSRVAMPSENEYTGCLTDSLTRAIRSFNFDLRGKSVLLKPNLVESLAGVQVNTNAILVEVAEPFLRLGANNVVMGEGPGFQRETYLVLVKSGLDDQFRGTSPSSISLAQKRCRPARASLDSITRGCHARSWHMISSSRCRNCRPTIGLGSL